MLDEVSQDLALARSVNHGRDVDDVLRRDRLVGQVERVGRDETDLAGFLDGQMLASCSAISRADAAGVRVLAQDSSRVMVACYND